MKDYWHAKIIGKFAIFWLLQCLSCLEITQRQDSTVVYTIIYTFHCHMLVYIPEIYHEHTSLNPQQVFAQRLGFQ